MSYQVNVDVLWDANGTQVYVLAAVRCCSNKEVYQNARFHLIGICVKIERSMTTIQHEPLMSSKHMTFTRSGTRLE